MVSTDNLSTQPALYHRLAVDYVLELEEYRLPNRVHGTVAIAKPNQYINV
ncbi:hypothetical protein [Coleofasciculus sp. E2-BRE-01]